MANVRFFWSVVAFTAWAIALGGCGESAVRNDGTRDVGAPTAQELEQAAEDWYDSHDAILMPWTRLLEDQVVDAAIVGPDRVAFPLDVADDLEAIERLDVLISGHPEKPFIRRVVDRTETGSEIVFQTKPAMLTEAIYKVDTTGPDEELQSLPDGTLFRTRESKLKAVGTKTLAGGEEDDHFTDEQGYYFKVDSAFSISPTVEFSLRIGGLLNDVYPQPNLCPNYEGFNSCVDPTDVPDGAGQNHCYCRYDSEIPCQRNSDCFVDEYCTANTCKYEAGFRHREGYEGAVTNEDNYLRRAMSCSEIIAALDAITKDEGCSEKMDDYYRNPTSYQTQSYCSPSTSGLARVVGFPTPAQIDWAKRACDGGLQVFEFDFRVTPTAELKGLEVGVQRSRKLDAEKTLATYKFPATTFVLPTTPPIPVVITTQPSLNVRASLEANAALKVAFNDYSYGVELRSGVHYYGTEQIAATYGQYAAPGEEPGTFHPNHYAVEYPRAVSQADGDGGFKLDPDKSQVEDQGVLTAVKDVNGDGKVSLLDLQQLEIVLHAELATEVAVKLYDAVGIKLNPLVGYGKVRFDTSADCLFGSKAGLKAGLGLVASLPLCTSRKCKLEGDIWSWNSCDGTYCPASGEPGAKDPLDGALCVEYCMSDDCVDPGEPGSTSGPKWVTLTVEALDADRNGSSVCPDGVNVDMVSVPGKKPTEVVVDGTGANEYVDPLQELSFFYCEDPYNNPNDSDYQSSWDAMGPSFSERLEIKFDKPLQPDDTIELTKLAGLDGLCKGTGQNIGVAVFDDRTGTSSNTAVRFSEQADDHSSETATVQLKNCPGSGQSSDPDIICFDYATQ